MQLVKINIISILSWSVTLREEYRLRVFENRVLKRIFGPNTGKVTQGSAPACSYSTNRFSAHSLLIALMMEAVNTSETSINFYQTTRSNIPEESPSFP
jgi:hypothetical protein